MNRPVARQERIAVDGVVAEVTYRAVRRLTLRVSSAAGPVFITAPGRQSLPTVIAFLRAQLPWIRRQQLRHRVRESVPPPAYAAGEILWYWGRRCTIERGGDGPPGVTLVGDRIRLHAAADAMPATCAALIEEWYRERMNEALEPLLARWARCLGLQVPHHRVRKMKSRWGSCSRRTQTVTFNLELVRRPPACLDYIVLHELVHFIVPPHNTRFYAIMDHFLPPWSDVRRELNARAVGAP